MQIERRDWKQETIYRFRWRASWGTAYYSIHRVSDVEEHLNRIPESKRRALDEEVA